MDAAKGIKPQNTLVLQELNIFFFFFWNTDHKNKKKRNWIDYILRKILTTVTTGGQFSFCCCLLRGTKSYPWRKVEDTVSGDHVSHGRIFVIVSKQGF